MADVKPLSPEQAAMLQQLAAQNRNQAQSQNVSQGSPNAGNTPSGNPADPEQQAKTVAGAILSMALKAVAQQLGIPEAAVLPAAAGTAGAAYIASNVLGITFKEGLVGTFALMQAPVVANRMIERAEGKEPLSPGMARFDREIYVPAVLALAVATAQELVIRGYRVYGDSKPSGSSYTRSELRRANEIIERAQKIIQEKVTLNNKIAAGTAVDLPNYLVEEQINIRDAVINQYNQSEFAKLGLTPAGGLNSDGNFPTRMARGEWNSAIRQEGLNIRDPRLRDASGRRLQGNALQRVITKIRIEQGMTFDTARGVWLDPAGQVARIGSGVNPSSQMLPDMDVLAKLPGGRGTPPVDVNTLLEPVYTPNAVEEANARINAFTDPKYARLIKGLTWASRLGLILMTYQVVKIISNMTGHHADYTNKFIDKFEYDRRMSDELGTLVGFMSIAAVTSLIGFWFGKKFGLKGAVVGFGAGLTLGFVGNWLYEDTPSGQKLKKNAGEILWDSLNQETLPTSDFGAEAMESAAASQGSSSMIGIPGKPVFERTQSVQFISLKDNTLTSIIRDEKGNPIAINRGGTRNLRNNNPLNLDANNWDFARSLGATDREPPGDGNRMAIFPTYAAGRRAADLNLRTPQYRDLTIKQAIYKWAPETVPGNNPEAYANFVALRTKLDVNTAKYVDLSPTEKGAVLDAMELHEGGSRPTVINKPDDVQAYMRGDTIRYQGPMQQSYGAEPTKFFSEYERSRMTTSELTDLESSIFKNFAVQPNETFDKYLNTRIPPELLKNGMRYWFKGKVYEFVDNDDMSSWVQSTPANESEKIIQSMARYTGPAALSVAEATKIKGTNKQDALYVPTNLLPYKPKKAGSSFTPAEIEAAATRSSAEVQSLSASASVTAGVPYGGGGEIYRQQARAAERQSEKLKNLGFHEDKGGNWKFVKLTDAQIKSKVTTLSTKKKSDFSEYFQLPSGLVAPEMVTHVNEMLTDRSEKENESDPFTDEEWMDDSWFNNKRPELWVNGTLWKGVLVPKTDQELMGPPYFYTKTASGTWRSGNDKVPDIALYKKVFRQEKELPAKYNYLADIKWTGRTVSEEKADEYRTPMEEKIYSDLISGNFGSRSGLTIDELMSVPYELRDENLQNDVAEMLSGRVRQEERVGRNTRERAGLLADLAKQQSESAKVSSKPQAAGTTPATPAPTTATPQRPTGTGTTPQRPTGTGTTPQRPISNEQADAILNLGASNQIPSSEPLDPSGTSNLSNAYGFVSLDDGYVGSDGSSPSDKLAKEQEPSLLAKSAGAVLDFLVPPAAADTPPVSNPTPAPSPSAPAPSASPAAPPASVSSGKQQTLTDIADVLDVTAKRIRWAQALPPDIDPLDFRLYDPKKIGSPTGSWYEGDELEEAIKKIRESRQGQGRPAETGSGPQIPTPPPQQNNVLNATMNELQGSFNPSTQSYVPYAREKAPDRYYDVVTGQIVQKSATSTPAPTPEPTPTASYDELFKTYSREELRRIIAERNINIDNLGLEEKKKLAREAKQAARERLQKENISPATPAPSSPTPTQQPTTPATTSATTSESAPTAAVPAPTPPTATPVAATPTSAVQTPDGDATTSTSTSGRIIGFRKEDYPEYEDYYKKALAEDANDQRFAAKEAELRLKSDLVSGKVKPRGTTTVEPSTQPPPADAPTTPIAANDAPVEEVMVEDKPIVEKEPEDEEGEEGGWNPRPERMPLLHGIDYNPSAYAVDITQEPPPAEPEFGAGINYGDAPEPTKMTLEGFDPHDYPREYAAAVRGYLAGTNIGSRKAREKAEALAAEDIRQAVLSGAIKRRRRRKSKMFPVSTTYQDPDITPQVRFQENETAEPVQSEIPSVATPTSESKRVTPNPEKTDSSATDFNSSMENLGLRLDAVTQLVEHALITSKTLSQSTNELGKKVASNTSEIDSNREFISAMNPDSSLKSFRKSYG